MIHVNPSKVQTRRACNRCHQAKLKCVSEGDRKCQRCKRSNTECTFSPPSRMQRQQILPRSPSSSSFSRTGHQLNGWSDIDFDWDLPVEPSFLATVGYSTDPQADIEFPVSAPYPMPIDYSNVSHIRNPASRPASQAELLTPTTLFDTSSSGAAIAPLNGTTRTFTGYNETEASRLHTCSSYKAGRNDDTMATGISVSLEGAIEELDEHPVDLAFWANKITPLFSQFTQHLQSLPRLNPDHQHHNNNHGIIPRPSGSHNSDHTFDLSESFINVLSGMCSKLPPLDAPRTADEDWSTKYLTIDEASYLLVLSTYLRFLEMQDTVFRYLLACLSHERQDTATGSCFYLPKLIIGSFSLAMTSETRPLLYVNLMESMLARAKNLFHRLASARAKLGNRDSLECFGGLSPIVEPTVALQAVQARETSIATLVERIKATLSRPKSYGR